MLSKNARVFLSILCFASIGVFYRSSWILSVYHDSFPPQNSSQTCLMEYTPWLSKSMVASPEPFLTQKNNITKQTFNWWTKLQSAGKSFQYYNETMKTLYWMFPHSPNLTQPSPDHCRTCAVVGNSGNLKGSRYGPLIDFHDSVIRINQGRVKGYEKDVGNRTTHRVMYPISASNLDNGTYLVFIPFKPQDLQWLIKSFTPSKEPNKSRLKANKDLVVILSPTFIEYVHTVWLKFKKDIYSSTGFLTLILSLHICDEVSLFGFGADGRGNWNHYWEEVVNVHHKGRIGHHDGSGEYEIIERLNEQKKIQLFKGW
ncbi:CMP-N-acetylneuraminate-beta-galactosamide-alpha-2,3-sialyltransferase 1-like [Anoplopoma fimbria]|uniref:CMP-N-acetylneuraminate-beta-galactosamide- alpha-2,3-sialyltransferase 1-like n=1 Tax=Anoplopoma fimbria TaxID=229290 RepID=UPI0023EE1D2A|nr:CMP-N-acetylneuraminate-beta-galactosamide-alpha-2,3-sialyltransferase 1-like [Anoplopoma fimbria]